MRLFPLRISPTSFSIYQWILGAALLLWCSNVGFSSLLIPLTFIHGNSSVRKIHP